MPSNNNTYKFAKSTAGILIIKDSLKAVLGLNFRTSKYEVVIPDLEIPGITANPCRIPVIMDMSCLRFFVFLKSDLIVFCNIHVIINPAPMIAVKNTFSAISRRLENKINPIMLDDMVDKITNVVKELISLLYPIL